MVDTVTKKLNKSWVDLYKEENKVGFILNSKTNCFIPDQTGQKKTRKMPSITAPSAAVKFASPPTTSSAAASSAAPKFVTPATVPSVTTYFNGGC